MKEIKSLTALFSVGVVGVALCLVMTIYTGIKENREKNAPPPYSMPTPAMPR